MAVPQLPSSSVAYGLYSKKAGSVQPDTPAGHASQLFQHTASNTVFSAKVKVRLVNPSIVLVHAVPSANSSWSVHPSTVNLYSMVPAGNVNVIS